VHDVQKVAWPVLRCNKGLPGIGEKQRYIGLCYVATKVCQVLLRSSVHDKFELFIAKVFGTPLSKMFYNRYLTCTLLPRPTSTPYQTR
jgi:hypothetical protein